MVRSEPTTGKKAREIRRFKKNSSKLPTGDRFPVWRPRGLGRCGRPWRSWGGPGVWPPPAASPAQPASSPAACPADPAERPPASPPPQVQSATVKKKIKTLFVSGSSRVHNFGRMHGFEIEVLRPQPVVPHTFLHSYYILFFEEENLVLS